MTHPDTASAQVVPQSVQEFRVADTNRDGVLSREEWQGSLAAFNRIDVNGDGVLTRREVLRGERTAVGQRADRFVDHDSDRDGVISMREWQGTRRSFEDRDVNGDGVVTRREFNAYDAVDTLEGNDAVRTSNRLREVVMVDSRQPWTDTGLYVEAGDVVELQASGRIRMSDNPDDWASPAGSVTGRFAPNAPVANAAAGGLLIRVGQSTVRFVGASGSFVAANSGPLYLGVNDDHLADNTGQYRVTLAVQDR